MDSLQDQEILCPLEDRRTPRELYVKLFVVNFTVLAAYIHLLRLRRDKFPLFYVFLAILTPIGSTALLLLPCCVLLFQLVFGYRLRYIKRSANLLFGTLQHSNETSTPNTDERVASYSASSSIDNNAWKTARRLLLPLALLSQSIASIWLFHRRVQRNAAVLYDHRILQLAVLGLSTAFLWIVQETFRPVCPSPSRLGEFSTHSWLEYMRYIPGSAGSEDQKIVWFVGLAPVVCGTTISLTKSTMGLMNLHWEHPYFPKYSNPWKQIPMVLVVGLGSVALLVAYLIVYCDNYFEGDRRRNLRKLRDFAIACFVSVILCVLVPLSMSVFWPWPFISGFYEYWILLGPEKLGIAHVEAISSLGSLPTQQPCPQAWKDPMADYVWWLA